MGRPLKTMKTATKDIGYPNFSDREAPVKNSAGTLNNNQLTGTTVGTKSHTWNNKRRYR